MKHPCLRLLAAALLVTQAGAQISPIRPFVGHFSEGFETLAPAGATICLAERIFGGAGELCTPGSPGATVETSWSFLCDLDPYAGDHLYGSSQGPSVYKFGRNVKRFGGYFASNGVAGVVHVRFLTDEGVFIDDAIVDVPNDCSWTWNGWEAESGLIGRVQVVNSSNGGGFVMMDEMRIDYDGLGTRYCVAAVNSTGKGAQISGHGTTSVFANDLLIVSSGQPAGTRGLFYYGGSAVQVPFGEGFRCVGSNGSGLQRLPLATADQQGVMHTFVDYTAIPNVPLFVFAGSTWNFQGLYRDPSGGRHGFNLTDALALTFLP